MVTYLLISFLFNLLSSAGAPLLKALFGPLKLYRLTWVEPMAPIVNLCLSLI
jgi:hypothetical protein